MNCPADINVTTETERLPCGWELTLLDSVAKRGSGHTPDKKHPEYWGGSIRWVSLQDSAQLDSLYIHDTAAKITIEGIKNSSAVLHPKGTVVLSRDAGVGKSAVMADDMAVSQHFMAWTCGQRLNNHFLYYWLQAKKPEFERIANGNTIKTIGLPYFKELMIPLPKADEQERIASALSNMDALISGLDQLIAKKRDIQQASMQQLLTGQRRLPGYSGEWEVKRLGDTCKITTGKKDVNEGNPSGQYPFFTCARENTYSDYYSFDCEAILVAGNGEVGNLNYYSGKFEAYQRTYVLYGFSADSKYIWHTLKFSLAESLGIGKIGSSIPYIKRSNLTNFELPLPSLEEQAAITDALSDIAAQLAALEARRDKARQIKQGMMQGLLTGKVRLV